MSSLDKLKELRTLALQCTSCQLHVNRTNVVFGVGSTKRPPIAIVGEAPGENEDLTSTPFIGRAGKVLDSVLVATGLHRDQVYITNTILCRPPNNRKPLPEEIAACSYHLNEQLFLVNPYVIVTLGAVATATLRGVDEAITKIRGNWFVWKNKSCLPSFHPSYILRDQSKKKYLIADMQTAMDKYRSLL